MSRGGRGGFRGRGRGRGLFGGSSALPLGLTPADIASLSREQSALYPERELPPLLPVNEHEHEIAILQMQAIERTRRSAYYIVEHQKSSDLPRYSDKYRIDASRPTLQKSDLNPAFFPPEIFEAYFNPKKKRKGKVVQKKKVNIDDIKEGDEDADENASDGESAQGSQAEVDDYGDEDDDNDYETNYFDPGDDDNLDDLGGGGRDEDGGETYD